MHFIYKNKIVGNFLNKVFYINKVNCNKYALCGNHGRYGNMVSEKGGITIRKNKSIMIKQKLNCNSFGIYAASCIRCGGNCLGQAKNSFSTRWNNHRPK